MTGPWWHRSEPVFLQLFPQFFLPPLVGFAGYAFTMMVATGRGGRPEVLLLGRKPV
ncbi:MAG: hypothetical protein ACE5KQ_03505 [Thermoplasmata archaeon]